MQRGPYGVLTMTCSPDCLSRQNSILNIITVEWDICPQFCPRLSRTEGVTSKHYLTSLGAGSFHPHILNLTLIQSSFLPCAWDRNIICFSLQPLWSHLKPEIWKCSVSAPPYAANDKFTFLTSWLPPPAHAQLAQVTHISCPADSDSLLSVCPHSNLSLLNDPPSTAVPLKFKYDYITPLLKMFQSLPSESGLTPPNMEGEVL